MAAEGIDFVLRIVAIAVLARMLIPEHFGLISMVTAITAVAERFKDAGLSIATVQSKEITHDQISVLFWVNVVFSGFLAAIVAGLAYPIVTFYGDERLRDITWAIALSFLFGGATVQHHALLRRTMQFRLIALIQLGASLGSIVIAVAIALLGGEYWALVAREVSRSVLLFVGSWLCMPWRPGRPKRGTNVRPMLGFGWHMMLTNIIFYVSFSLDHVLVGRMFGATALGFYRQGYNLVTAPAVQIGYPAGLVGEPALARLRERPQDYRLYLHKLLTILSFISMPSLFFVVVYADALVAIALGPGWDEATNIFRVLGLAFFMQPTANMAGCVMISCGLGRRTVALSLLNAVTLVSMFLLCSRFGPEGIAFAHAATFFVLLWPKLVLSTRGTPATPGLFVSAVWRPLVCTLGAGAAMAGFREVVPIERPSLELLAGVAGGLVVYLGLWAIDARGRTQLRGMVADLKSLRASRSPAG